MIVVTVNATIIFSSGFEDRPAVSEFVCGQWRTTRPASARWSSTTDKRTSRGDGCKGEIRWATSARWPMVNALGLEQPEEGIQSPLAPVPPLPGFRATFIIVLARCHPL